MNKKLKYLLLLFVALLFSCSEKELSEKILYDFETDLSLDQFHWRCHTLFSLTDQHATSGKKSLKMEFYPSPYPGIAPQLVFNDWSRYDYFSFDVFNPLDTAVHLTLRIDDQKDAFDFNQRYNKRLKLKPGMNYFKIPLKSLKTSNIKRPLNLREIYQFLLFIVDPKQKYTLYFDNFKLAKE